MSISPIAQSSTSSARRPLIVRALLLAALLFAAAGAALASAPAALAHDELISSTPAGGARLDAAPTEIELTFSSALMDLGNQIQVLDADGQNLAQSGPVLNRETLVQPLPAELPDGDYTVNWRAVSSDGHPITGTFSFLVGTDAAEGTGESAEGTQETAVTEATETAEVTETAEATEASNDAGLPAWVVPGILGGLTGLIAYAVYAFVSHRKAGRTK